jgi:hypothetical protein
MKKFLQSFREIAGRFSAVASQRREIVLAAVFLRPTLSFERAFSIGLRAGL